MPANLMSWLGKPQDSQGSQEPSSQGKDKVCKEKEALALISSLRGWNIWELARKRLTSYTHESAISCKETRPTFAQGDRRV